MNTYPLALIAIQKQDPQGLTDILELCLDICTPSTLGHLWHDHTNYIAAHQSAENADQWGDMTLIQQDTDLIYQHLTEAHFKGDPAAAQQFLNNLNHIPF